MADLLCLYNLGLSVVCVAYAVVYLHCLFICYPRFKSNMSLQAALWLPFAGVRRPWPWFLSTKPCRDHVHTTHPGQQQHCNFANNNVVSLTTTSFRIVFIFFIVTYACFYLILCISVHVIVKRVHFLSSRKAHVHCLQWPRMGRARGSGQCWLVHAPHADSTLTQ